MYMQRYYKKTLGKTILPCLPARPKKYRVDWGTCGKNSKEKEKLF